VIRIFPQTETGAEVPLRRKIAVHNIDRDDIQKLPKGPMPKAGPEFESSLLLLLFDSRPYITRVRRSNWSCP